MNLNPGDPCKVRLHDGRVVEAVYDHEAMVVKKHHWVIYNGRNYLAGDEINDSSECRFVGPSCVLEPV